MMRAATDPGTADGDSFERHARSLTLTRIAPLDPKK
jgi:hypothetical protein